MNKIAIAVLGAALTALTVPALAANAAQQNAAADAGMEAPGAQNNTTHSSMGNGDMKKGPSGITRSGNGTPTRQIDKNMPCNAADCTNNSGHPGRHHSGASDVTPR